MQTVQSLLAQSGIITGSKAWESSGSEVSIMIHSSRVPNTLWQKKKKVQYPRLTVALRPVHNILINPLQVAVHANIDNDDAHAFPLLGSWDCCFSQATGETSLESTCMVTHDEVMMNL